MAKARKPHKTFHINVPEEDLEVMNWLSVQYNQSSSLRELIRAAAQKLGMVDLFLGEPAKRTPGVRGRAKQPKIDNEMKDLALDSARMAVEKMLDENDIEAPKDMESDDIESDNKKDSKVAMKTTKKVAKSGKNISKNDKKAKVQEDDEDVIPTTRKRTRTSSTTARSPSDRKVGIKMDLSVLAGASGNARNIAQNKTSVKDKKKDGDKKKDAIRDLMDMMDL